MKEKISILQGPRFKNEATVGFENLVKNLLSAKSRGETPHVSYQRGHLIINIANQDYDLTELLEGKVDWEQFDLSNDLDRYEVFLNSPETQYKHILQNLRNADNSQVDMNAIQLQYPNLKTAEFSAIRTYTGEFYTAINHLLRFNGQKEFPLNPEGEFRQALDRFKQADGSYDLNQLVTEIILHSSFAAFALSKAIQDQKSCYVADSLATLEELIPHLKGVGLAIVGQGDLRSIAVIEFGKIQNLQGMPNIHLKDLHLQIQNPAADLWKFNQQEMDELRQHLNHPQNFSVVPEDLKARFFACLGMLVDSEKLAPARIFYRGDRSNPFMQSFIKNAIKEIREGGSVQAAAGFYSASQDENVARGFLNGNDGSITEVTSKAPRDISGISKIPSERENLFLPGQQFHYTLYQEAQGQPVIIKAEAIRGIGIMREEISEVVPTMPASRSSVVSDVPPVAAVAVPSPSVDSDPPSIDAAASSVANAMPPHIENTAASMANAVPPPIENTVASMANTVPPVANAVPLGANAVPPGVKAAPPVASGPQGAAAQKLFATSSYSLFSSNLPAEALQSELEYLIYTSKI